MRTITIVLLAVLMMAGCKKKEVSEQGSQPFFIFDQADHYHRDITSEEISDLHSNQEKTREDIALLQIVTGNVPVNPLDTLFIKNMDVLQFSKKTIDAQYHDKLSDIFSLKDDSNEAALPNCSAEYRDILVFRQRGRVVGVAKISFGCKKQQMVGMRYNPMDFGKHGEFVELAELLKNGG